ncbi:MAG: UvrD-helicase domain-containing protein [Flavobacteriales bacterium]|nr:MAG: UvrD-helicase domain-containing protein [Flavobacteriales bacterium]
MMVIAGAGSGKTKVLTVRIAHLMAAKEVDPFRILALTFTNKAAREMKERIAHLLADVPGLNTEARNLWMGTFHSVFARILRSEAEKLGYPSNFTIYDTDDSRSLIRSIVKEMQLDDKMYKPSQVHGRISICKNNLIGPVEYANDAELITQDTSTGRPQMAAIYRTYAERCFRAGAMDFDDLLYNTALLFRDHPEAMLKYQQRFQYILVDEYQDTNLVQYNIVKTLAARHENITVVGDDSQSIYAFRGANIQNILNFRKDYPDHQLFKLEQNYRSTGTIVGAANSLIDHNKEQIKKTIWTQNEQGDLIHVHRAPSDNEEGSFVAHDIFEHKMQKQLPNRSFAILYRTNAQSRSMEEGLRKLNIPYRIYGGLSFYQRKEIKDLLAYFRLTCNPQDEEALKRIINYPVRGIGQTTIEKLVVQSSEAKCSIWDLLTAFPERGDGGMLSQGATGIHGGTRKALGDFVTMIQSFRTMLESHSAYALAEHIARTSGMLKEFYADRTPEGISRYENIQELLNGIKEFSDANEDADVPRTLPDFLIDVALLTDADKTDDPNDNDRVSLMTIHSAKGLEFPYVYVVGLEEELFPNQMSMSSRQELEEERRLFYVALTRARTRATLSYAVSRYRWGNLTAAEPSRFIEEIDAKYLKLPNFSERSFSTERTPPWASRTGAFGRSAGFQHDERPARTPAPSRPVAPPQPSTPTPAMVAKRGLKRVDADKTPAAEGFTTVDGLEVGAQVEHERFGKGKVLSIEGRHPDLKATIFFPSAGQKQLLLRFAKLKVV